MIAIERVKRISRNGGRLKFWCPGCDDAHVIAVAPSEDPWEWDGDTTEPTISPSILVQGGARNITCHSFIRGGRIEFLSDCTHELAGQTVELGEHSPL